MRRVETREKYIQVAPTAGDALENIDFFTFYLKSSNYRLNR